MMLIGFGWLIPREAGAAAITSAGSGNWSATAWPNTVRTGTITTSNASTTVTGTGTAFTTEISVGNIIKTTGNTAIGTVASIQSNTQLTLTGNAASNNTAINYNFQGVGTVDTVTIATGNTVTVDVNSTCASLTFPATSTVATAVTISGTNTLTVTGAVNLARASAASNTINVGAGTLSAGSVALSGTTGGSRTTIINISTGTVNVSGNITSAGVDSRIVFSGSGTLNAGGSFMPTAGTVTASTGTVNYNGTGAQTITAYNYYNLTISGAHTTNNITLAATGTIGVAGTFNPTATFSTGGYVRTGSTVNFNGTGAQTVPSFNYNNLTISGAHTTNNVTLASSGTIGVAGTLNSTATFTTGAYVTTGSTVNYSGAAQNVVALAYNNLTFSGSGAKTTVSGTSVAGNLNIASGVTATVGAPFTANSLTLGGLGTVNSTWGGTGTGAANISSYFTAGTSGNYVTVSTDTRTAQATLSVTGPVSVTYGSTGTMTTSGGSGSGTMSYSHGASTGCTVNSSSGVISVNDASGSCTVTATKASDANYTAATSAGFPVTLNKATPTASISNSPVTYSGSAQTAIVACLGGGAATLASGGTGTIVGSYPATVDCAASTNYNAATGLAAGNFVIDKADQTIGAITFTPPSLTVSGTTTASATATSGLSVNFSSDTLSVCTVSGNIVTGVSAGTCTVRAIQAGNGNYNPATDLTQNIEVTSGTVTLDVTVVGNGSVSGDLACSSGTCGPVGFTSGTPISLAAAPSWNYDFSGWSGACTGTGSCNFTLNVNSSVTATFLAKQLVMIGSTPYATIQEAYAAAAADALLKIRDQAFTENLVFNGANVTFDGGYEATWTTATGFTAINGDVTIIAGGVTVSNMVIQ